MIMATIQANKNTDAQNLKESRPVPEEIEAARVKVRDKENKVWWAKFWLIIGLVSAGAIGIGIAVVTLRSDWMNDELRAAEKELTALEMAKIKADSERKSEADANKVRAEAAEALTVKTEEVRQEAKTEQKRIEIEGQERVAKVEAESREKIAGLTAESEQARAAIATAQAIAATASAKAETERFQRIKLEKELAPRVIPLIGKSGEESNLAPLRRFGKQEVVIEFLPEIETRRATAGVITALTSSGWKVVSVTPNANLDHPMWDGVVVQSAAPNLGLSPEEHMKAMKQGQESNEAGNALVKFLRDNDWAANRHAVAQDIPPNSLKVSIGFKPPPKPRFLAEWERDVFGQGERLPLERTEPRHITEAHREVIVKYLSLRLPPKNMPELPGIIPVEIRCPEENGEACKFAEEISEFLRANGWPVVNNAVVRDKSFPRTLAGILVQSTAERPSAGYTLADAFKAAGFEVKGVSELGTRYDPLLILVGW